MKYTIETTEKGCIETLEFGGKTYRRENERTDYGCRSDRDVSEQLETDGIDNAEVLEKVYDLFDGFMVINFLEVAELDC